MTRLLAGLVIMFTLCTVGCDKGGEGAGAAGGSAPASNATVEAEIRAVMDRYAKGVNEADEDGLRELWAEPEKVSFVSPIQRIRSWDEMHGFIQGFLKGSFTRRELKFSEVALHTAGDTAWAVFDWEFNATTTDGKPFQSRGWETQIYQKTDRGWRIRHIHYSAAMPPPAEGKPIP